MKIELKFLEQKEVTLGEIQEILLDLNSIFKTDFHLSFKYEKDVFIVMLQDN